MNRIRHLLTPRTGSILTILLCLILIWIYLNPVVRSLNTTLFSTAGDGLRSYYSYLYHIQYDTSSLRFDGMNYPWGESVFCTDNQPYLSVGIRGLCDLFPGLIDYSIAIWNGLLLISIAITALFLYLLLIELGLPVLLSMIGGIAIALLSPQINRMGAHYSLSYGWVIPLTIWLLLKFSRKPSFKYSIVLFILMIWSGATHMYFIAMMGMLIALFWIFFIIGRKKEFGSWKVWLPHLLIQLVVPILLVELLISLSSSVTDRASYPFGFFYYRAYPESVFLPVDRIYGRFLHKIIDFDYINWEGFAYMGILATLGCALFLGKSLTGMVRGRFRTALAYDNSLFLSFLFWSSFLILLYSFGVPFVLGLEKLVDYLGPVRQFRGIGRFAWVFYYSMNILVLYSLYQLFIRKKSKTLPVILLTVAFGVLLAEAHYNFKHILPFLNNQNRAFTDIRNRLPENDWVNRIHPQDYQSILPLPYYHIGSESLWIEAACGIDKASYLVSVKTGLPLQSVMLGRTSLSQTYLSVELPMEPYRKPAILGLMDPDKPILVLSAPCEELKTAEKLILNHSEPLVNVGEYQLSSIYPDSLISQYEAYIQSRIRSVDSAFRFDGRFYTMGPATPAYLFQDCDSDTTEGGYQSASALRLSYKKMHCILDHTLDQFTIPGPLTVSFWMKGICHDNMARVRLETVCYNNQDKVETYLLSEVGRSLKQLDGEWGLIELTFDSKAGQRIQLALMPEILREDMVIDNLLVRNSTDTLSGLEPGKGWWINNRFYPLQQPD